MKKKHRIETNPESRRDFLKTMGISAGLGSFLWSCEQQVTKAIPYLVQPEEITTGRALHYASTYCAEGEYCPIVVRVINGRPVKIEGNNLSEITKEGTNARVQASILGLYDPDRLQNPSKNNEEITWLELDKEIIEQLQNFAENKEKIVLLAEGIISPSTLKGIEQFLEVYPNVRFYNFAPFSLDAYYKAISESLGQIDLKYNFEEADFVLSFQNDFLGAWKNPVEFSRAYSNRKAKLDAPFQHIQLETNYSLTGANADFRIAIKPSEEKKWLLEIYNELSGKSSKTEAIHSKLSSIMQKLKNSKGKSIVLSGSQDVDNQKLVLGINELLNNFERTIDLVPTNHFDFWDKFQILRSELENGEIEGAIFYGVNPAYYFPDDKLKMAIKALNFSVSLSVYNQETNQLCNFVCPDNHYLESWNDYEYQGREYAFGQPVIQPLFNTRQAQDSLLKWSAVRKKYSDQLKESWNTKLGGDDINLNPWLTTIQNGVLKKEYEKKEAPNFDHQQLAGLKADIESGETEFLLVESYKQKDFNQANNPWLHELPDPVSKTSWSHFAGVSSSFAFDNQLEPGDEIAINNIVKLPIAFQPGHAENCISIETGYGRTGMGEIAKSLGVNAFSLDAFSGKVSIKKTGQKLEIAKAQTQDSLEGRDLIKEFSIGETDIKKEAEVYTSFYSKPNFAGIHWGMAIDQNRCLGCSTCVLACQIENNIPVVGKEEMLRNHGMHWIRIDRYYSDEMNPKVQYQPVMCQHCDAAPCENVCPVSATNHSVEGINQMAYNRCVGTRYCANNCPYKTRRFNWLDYTRADRTKGNEAGIMKLENPLPRLVLNPNVSVRTKGVIEKCSFCIQRIQEKKTEAKLENRKLEDGEVRTACAQACPANAIVFGDMNDTKSKISEVLKSNRYYMLLGQLNTLPSVTYLGRVRNERGLK